MFLCGNANLSAWFLHAVKRRVVIWTRCTLTLAYFCYASTIQNFTTNDVYSLFLTGPTTTRSLPIRDEIWQLPPFSRSCVVGWFASASRKWSGNRCWNWGGRGLRSRRSIANWSLAFKLVTAWWKPAALFLWIRWRTTYKTGKVSWIRNEQRYSCCDTDAESRIQALTKRKRMFLFAGFNIICTDIDQSVQ